MLPKWADRIIYYPLNWVGIILCCIVPSYLLKFQLSCIISSDAPWLATIYSLSFSHSEYCCYSPPQNCWDNTTPSILCPCQWLGANWPGQGGPPGGEHHHAGHLVHEHWQGQQEKLGDQLLLTYSPGENNSLVQFLKIVVTNQVWILLRTSERWSPRSPIILKPKQLLMSLLQVAVDWFYVTTT